MTSNTSSGQADAKSLQGNLAATYGSEHESNGSLPPPSSGSTRTEEKKAAETKLKPPQTPSGERQAQEQNEIKPPAVSFTVTVASVLINLLALATPLVILQVYDRIIPNAALSTFTLLLCGLIAALILEAVMRTARSWLTGWAAAQYEVNAAEACMRNLLEAGSAQIESERSSLHIFRLNAIDTLRQFYGGQSRLLMIDLPFVLLFVGLIWVIAGPLVFVPLVLFGAFGALTIRHGFVLRRLLLKRDQHDIERHRFAMDALSSISGVKASVSEALFQRTHDRFGRQGAALNYETVVLGAEAHSLSAVFSNAAVVAVVSIGAFHVVSGQLSIGALAAVTLLTGRSMQPLVRALGLWSQLQNLQIARGHLEAVFEWPEEEIERQAKQSQPLEGEIVLQEATLPTATADVEHDGPVNFTARANQLTVVRPSDGVEVGPFAHILTGTGPVSGGKLLFDGRPSSQFAKAQLREQIACVGDRPILFEGTILQNITMFRRGEALDQALDAAQQIGLEEQVNRLPDGYGTQMVKGASPCLPSGIVQLTMLARALARRPRILILVNPLQRLDRRLEGIVLDALTQMKGETTIIAFAHHPGLVERADSLYDLGEGSLRVGSKGAQRAGAPQITVGAARRFAND